MKIKLRYFILSFVLGIFLLGQPIFLKAVCKDGEKGGASAEALSDALFQALKQNNFELLQAFVPSSEEITYLIKTATAKNKPYFESLNVQKINTALQNGFNKIIRKGIVNEINWNEVALVDYKTRSCNIELIGCNVTFTMQDQNDKSIVVSYDAVKVKDRWFLFQNLGLGN